MAYYIGLDVSMKETFVCVVNQEGKRVHEKSIPTEPHTITMYLRSLNLEIALIGLESGSLSHWLTTSLKELELPVKCIDARHIAAVLSVNINKTDKNDARGIADAMRCGLYKEVQAKEPDQIALNTLLNARKQLVDQRTQTMGCIRGLLKPYGIRLGSIGSSARSLDTIRKELYKIPDVGARGMESLLCVLKVIIEQIKILDIQVRELVQNSKPATLLKTIPGIGAVTSLRFLAEIGKPTRFKRSKSVGAYVGMTPTQYSSGERTRLGRISKCGPKDLRSLLMEAGIVLITRSKCWSKLKVWGMKLQRRHGLKKAGVAVGRKLATIMHRMLLTETPFQHTDKEKRKVA